MDLTSLTPNPTPIPEKLVHQFCFIAEGGFHTGMSLDNKLYKLHKTFKHNNKAAAFALAVTLSEQGETAIVTVSSARRFYRVWIDLRSIRTLNDFQSQSEQQIAS